MKNYGKNIILRLMLATILMFSLSVNVFAEKLEDAEKVVEDSKLVDGEVSEVTIKNPLRGNILNQGTARISNNGNGSVNVYGAVFGSVVCDKLILEMTLQRFENERWVNVKFFSDVAYNQALLTKSYNVNVTKGYYYRMKAGCVAQKGSTSESKLPITDGIWIG